MPKSSRLDPSKLLGNPRATFAAWKKYETMALASYHAYPNAYVWEPDGMAPCTVATRLRDAIRGCLAFKHPISEVYEITHADLESWFDQVVFKYTDMRVLVGPPQKVIDELEGAQVGSLQERKGLTFPSLDFEEVNAFLLLLSRGRLVGPIIIHSPPDISLLSERPNVEAVPRPDGSLLLL